MAEAKTDSYKQFARFIAQTGDTYAFDGESSIAGLGIVFQVIQDMGLKPMHTEEFKRGILSLFNVEVLNMPDLDNSRLIFAPNHVSDLDALILGLLHPKIRIASKTDWTDNEKLKHFLGLHYDLQRLNRACVQSLHTLLKSAVAYFNENTESRHYLLFSQGTISDFNQNSLERISKLAQKISNKADVPIVPLFIEQPSLYHPTRIVFDAPMMVPPEADFRRIWLERETALQNTLSPPARLPKLSHKHSNNNKPGDPFFP